MENMQPLPHQAFKEVFGLFEQAFPKSELRLYEDQRNLLKDPRYALYGLRKEEKLVVAAAVWRLPGCHFLEHLAVDSACRGKGLGAFWLKAFLDGVQAPVILEVENPAQPLQKRRVAFYQRLGFHLSPYGYLQPPLQSGQPPEPLLLMRYPQPFSEADFRAFKKQVFEIVYQSLAI